MVTEFSDRFLYSSRRRERRVLVVSGVDPMRDSRWGIVKKEDIGVMHVSISMRVGLKDMVRVVWN